MSTFQVIRVYFHKHEAQMAQGLLKNAGIQAIVSTDDAAGSRPHLTLGMGEIRLLVHESDYGRAQEILKVMDEPLSEDEVRQLDDMALGAAESGDGKLSPPAYWYEETRCDVLIRIPEVRDLIACYAAMAKRPLPGEGFLALCDKVFPSDVSLQTAGAAARSIYAALGINVQKEHSETLPIPPGKVIVSVLCFFARHGQSLTKVRQFSDGCLLEAGWPSDLWFRPGTVYVGARRVGGGTRVDGAIEIKGQMFDWGKSSRWLAELFSTLKGEPAGY